MKTATFLFVVVASASALACAAAATPAVVAVSSPAMEVHQPQLKFEDGAWRLAGCVAPRRGGQARQATHLDVVSLDASGAWLATTEVPLKAATLRLRPRAPRPHSRYELSLDSASFSAARIEVRAHDHASHQP